MPSHQTVFFDTSNSKRTVTPKRIQACSIQRLVDILHYSNIRKVFRNLCCPIPNIKMISNAVTQPNRSASMLYAGLFGRPKLQAKERLHMVRLEGSFIFDRYVCLFVCSNNYYLLYRLTPSFFSSISAFSFH